MENLKVKKQVFENLSKSLFKALYSNRLKNIKVMEEREGAETVRGENVFSCIFYDVYEMKGTNIRGKTAL